MLYITTKGKLNDPRIKAMPRTALGESWEEDVWTNQVRVDTWKAVMRRNPTQPWKNANDLRGAAEGKTVLILGSGKSLSYLKTIPEGVVTLAVNRAVRHLKPDYWCLHDVDTLAQNMDHPNAEGVPWVCCIQLYSWLKDRPAYLVEVNGEPNRWRDPALRPFYWAESTTGWAIHLAIRMGAKKIVLYGHDYPGNGHFDDYVQAGRDKVWQLGQHFGVMERLLEMFSEAEKPQWLERPVEIVDATPGGFLPLPKVNLEAALA
jgi:hypothetical protein